jgi:SAM-dependent methyltransferase
MPESVAACPLCGEATSLPFDQRVFRGIPVVNRMCGVCGFVYQSPRMTDTELQEFYAAEYRRLYQGSAGPSAKDVAVQTQRAGGLLDFLQAAMKTSGAITEDSICLDIGCSAGKLLDGYARAFGCRVVGIEPGDAYRQDDQRRGLDVYASLESFEQSGQFPVDLISLIHVLEHLPHPVQYLANLRQKILQAGGGGIHHGGSARRWLLLEVPNLYCHNCFEVAHLTSFSEHTLTQMVQQAGFKVVALKKHGAPRSHWLPLYITLLARAEDAAGVRRAVIPEKNVQLKRRLGMFRRRVITRLFPSQAWIPLPDESENP